MTASMKAAQMVAVAEDLRIAEVPVPTPGPGELLVKLDACGICHTDLHAWQGDQPLPRELPAVLGHEGVGRVTATGGATRHSVGERVGVGFVYGTCGACRECLSGHETHCATVQSTGVHVDGCYAEYAVLRDDWATAIPEELDAVEAAPLLCAGVAAYSAVRKAQLEPGSLAVVFGAGGLGFYAIQLARLCGARVVAVDIDDAKLEKAIAMGADHAVRGDADPGAYVQRLGGADACFNFAPVTATWEQMLEAARARARLVLISLPVGEFRFHAASLIERGLRVMGSADGSRQELRQLMALAREGRVHSLAEAVPLADINHAFGRLAAGDVTGRLVVRMPG